MSPHCLDRRLWSDVAAFRRRRREGTRVSEVRARMQVVLGAMIQIIVKLSEYVPG